VSAAGSSAAARPAESCPFSAPELADWRRLLLEHRAAALREPPDAGATLRLIDRALAKIDGRGPLPFGLCEHTHRPIGAERLRLMPWTPFSIEGATDREERFLTVDDLLVDRALPEPACQPPSPCASSTTTATGA
jgi:RNA polymerase-binding transcription factor DksA